MVKFMKSTHWRPLSCSRTQPPSRANHPDFPVVPPSGHHHVTVGYVNFDKLYLGGGRNISSNQMSGVACHMRNHFFKNVPWRSTVTPSRHFHAGFSPEKFHSVAVKPATPVHLPPPPLRNKMGIWYRYAELHLDTSPPILAPCIIVLTILCYSSTYSISKGAIYKIGRFLPATLFKRQRGGLQYSVAAQIHSVAARHAEKG